MLAGLLNIPSGDGPRNTWAFDHQDHHRKIQNSIFQTYGVAIPDFILDPMPPFNDPSFSVWAYQHQSATTAYEGILNIPSDDFTDVDYTKDDQVYSWLRLHFQSHFLAEQALGFLE